jgi:putative lipoprotein (rSAM/lipoprotein system)
MNCKLIRWILGILGFSTVATSCEIIDEIGGGGEVCMYGCPSADYVFNVEVLDSESHAPIEGIKLDISGYSNEYEYSSVTTSADGKATLRLNAFPKNSHTLLVEDVDGEENGSYNSTSVIVSTDSNDYKNPGEYGWYEGTATHDVLIEMTPKTE